MDIRCIIIDDEPLARKGIEGFLRQLPGLACIGQYAGPQEAAAAIQQADLLFLDIEMPRMNGFQFLKSLPHPPAVIITTAYPQYALEAYDFAVVDYLVKPIPFERFLSAVQKARTYLSHTRQPQTPEAGFFFVKCDTNYVKIQLDELLVVEARQNYIALHTTRNRYTTYLTLKGVEEQLPPDQFLKVHKSFIVNRQHVLSFNADEIMIGTLKIPYSRQHKQEIMDRLLTDKLIKRKP